MPEVDIERALWEIRNMADMISDVLSGKGKPYGDETAEAFAVRLAGNIHDWCTAALKQRTQQTAEENTP